MAKVAIQGGVKNYLPSKEVTVPVEAKSSKNHVKAHLAYITDKEQKFLIEKNLHGSLKGKPNRGPGGLPSLQGDFGPGGNNPGGFSSNQGGPGGTGNTGDKGGIGSGEESAFRDTGTGDYNLSNRLSDRQAVIDYAKGNMGFQKGKKPSFFGGPGSLKQRQQIYNARRNIKNIERLQKTRMNKLQHGLMTGNIPGIDTMTMQEMIDLAPSMKSFGYTDKTINDILSGKRANIDFAVPSGLPSIAGMVTNQLGKVMSGPVTREKLNELYGEYNDLGALNPAAQTTFGLMEKYEPNRYAREFGPPVGGDGDGGQQFIPIDYNTGAGTTEVVEPYTNDFTYRFGTGQNVGADVLRGYVANGGRIGKAFGGIMDSTTGRKAYGLGSIFKSVGKAIGGVADAAGKVLKSDVGKMALLAAGAYYAPAMFGGTTGFGAGSTYGNLARTAGKKLFLNQAGKMSLPKILGLSAVLPFMPGINKAPENEDIGMADRGGRLIDPLTGEEGTPASMRANIENAKIEAGGDPVKLAALNQAYNNMLFTNLPYANYGNYAQGGRIRAEEGGLMNLGGMEKDYRAEGGFVPIGKQEKADDVPARLSVNEFVFTADAVRNAGGGDIDKGAEVMENMMKNLENGGRVSEESQGNTGAQEMFSVSERIGEVI
mgnify:CR=1 FL=1